MRTVNDNLWALMTSEFERPYTHGLLLSVQSGDGRISFEGALGDGASDSPYFVASISKMYTATVLMQLVDEGRVDLNDHIQPYLSHLPLDGIHVHKGTDYSDQLKVCHLVHQTSGLADYFTGSLLEDFKKGHDHSYSVGDVLEIIRGMRPFAAPDSGKSHYSDTNYQLLGALIETITERPLAEIFKERIFDPLKMAGTYLYDFETPRSITPLPFYHENNRLSLPLAMTSERGAGAAVSTMADTHRFLQAYFQGRLFKAAHFTRMMTWKRMFFPMQYGYGLWRFKLPRWLNLFRKTSEFIGHAGVNGAMAFYNPEHDVYIAGTLNQIDDPARQFTFMPKVMRAISQGQAAQGSRNAGSG